MHTKHAFYTLPLMAILTLVWSAGCGSNSKDTSDAFVGNHNWTPPDASSDGGEGNDAHWDAQTETDASDPCAPVPEGRTGTTIRALDNFGEDATDPIEPGTLLTIYVKITVDTPPDPQEGFLKLRPSNLTIDASSFLKDGSAMTVPSPFSNTVPIALTTGTTEVTFQATVENTDSTIELDSWLVYGDSGQCHFPQSHSLAILQVLGGESERETCYNLDESRSVQVTPAIPIQSTSEYLNANGNYDAVLIDNLVVGTQCPGPGVLVHQINKCYTRSSGSTVSLSGAAYGGVEWNVDDILLVEVLDGNKNVVSAFTTYQITNQAFGCCDSPPCTSELAYSQGGPNVSIENTIQGGGDNGTIAAGAFNLTAALPNDGSPFYLRFTALDQGIEGLISRVFLNVD